MHSSINDIPVAFEAQGYTSKLIQWGDINVEVWSAEQDGDPAPFFKGLPDDRCQCPHYGYVLKGSMIYDYADREEVITAGQVYYIAPGHLPRIAAGSMGIEFSPKHEFEQTMEVLSANMAAMMG